MANSVVLKMLGWNIGFTALQNRLYGIWRPSQPFQLMDIENGYFLAKFQNVVSGTVGNFRPISNCQTVDNRF